MKTKTKIIGVALTGVAVLGIGYLGITQPWKGTDDVWNDTYTHRHTQHGFREYYELGPYDSCYDLRQLAVDGSTRRRMEIEKKALKSDMIDLVQLDYEETLAEPLKDEIQSALEEDDFKALLTLLPRARESNNAEVRLDLVEALGWFGKEAMLELLPMMADPDESVAEAAVDNWKFALSDIEDEKEKSVNVEMVMKGLRNKDALESVVMELDDCDDVVEIQALVNVIESGNPIAAEVAREHYEFITDEKYIDLETANRWLTQNTTSDDA